MNRVAEKVKDFQRQLMLSASSPNVARNENELALIGALETMLDQATEGRPLDASLLEKAHHKTSRVQCFGERYQPIIYFLDEYNRKQT